MTFPRRFLVALVFGIGKLPMSMRRRIAWIVGAILGGIPIRDQKIARLQLTAFLEPKSKAPPVRRIYESFCLTFLESLNLMPVLDNDSNQVHFDQWEEFRRFAAGGKGVIYLTGHTGNWELLAAYMHKHGVDFHALGRQARHPVTQEILEKVRARYGVRTLWRQDSAGVKEIIRVLKRGGGIAALIDQDTNVSSGYAPFFGAQCKTPVALVSLAQKLGCRMCALFLVREGKSNYRIMCSALDESKDVIAILSEFNAKLEQVVRSYPAQWPWFHKRWRSRPDGRKFSSKEYIECLRARPQKLFNP